LLPKPKGALRIATLTFVASFIWVYGYEGKPPRGTLLRSYFSPEGRFAYFVPLSV